MTLDLINSAPEETRQQLSELFPGADQAVAVDQVATEIERVAKFAKQGEAKWMGSKKGRQDNLSRAINASIRDLKEKGLSLDNNSIIGNLWIVDVGLDEFHRTIQEIIDSHDDKKSYVAWLDRRGVERITNFNSVKARIRRRGHIGT